jgi:hypothetical protein
MMPGNSVRDFSLTDFKKRSMLNMRGGVLQVTDPNEASGREELLAKTLARKMGLDAGGAPEHVLFDGKVRAGKRTDADAARALVVEREAALRSHSSSRP